MADFLKTEKKYGLTGAVLKNTAYITMLIDHFFAVVFLNYMQMYTVDGRWDPQLESVHIFNCGGVLLYKEQSAVTAAPFSICADLGDSF